LDRQHLAGNLAVNMTAVRHRQPSGLDPSTGGPHAADSRTQAAAQVPPAQVKLEELGASHQTGWTGLVTKLIQQSGGSAP
jgi:hypothetical protein